MQSDWDEKHMQNTNERIIREISHEIVLLVLKMNIGIDKRKDFML